MTAVVVVGGGVNGLATAVALLRRGARVTLLERFRIGHDRGSSHGASRITRTAYAEARYARLMAVARAEDWPRLERDAGRRLVHPAPGCFFGPPSARLDRYVRSVVESGADVERLDAHTAAPRFKALRFDTDDVVLDDRTAGIVAAADTVAALAALLRVRGADVREDTPVVDIVPEASGVRVATPRGDLQADRVVLTVNAWTRHLVPELARPVVPVRQTVAYLRLSGDAAAARAPAFPVWAYVAPASGLHRYGLPEFGRDGVKLAAHRVSGADDPDARPLPDTALVDDLVAFAAQRLTLPVASVLHAETCLYACTPTEDFVLTPHPRDARIVIGAGFSGHGFKFAPLTGRLLAELALDGRTTVSAFERERAAFGGAA